MEFRGQKINFAGIDYQRKGSPYLVGAERLIEPGVTNILLSHNPDVFPVAAAGLRADTLRPYTWRTDYSRVSGAIRQSSAVCDALRIGPV